MIVSAMVPLPLSALKIGQIANGWIDQHELMNNDTRLFTVKCNRNAMLNSNSSAVYLVELPQSNNETNSLMKWMPANGFLMPGLPLCSSNFYSLYTL